MRMLIATVVGLLALATASASGSPSACIAGEKNAGGGKVIVNCGPATATVRVSGKTYRFSQGLCQSFDSYTVNIGTTPYFPPTPEAALQRVQRDFSAQAACRDVQEAGTTVRQCRLGDQHPGHDVPSDQRTDHAGEGAGSGAGSKVTY